MPPETVCERRWASRFHGLRSKCDADVRRRILTDSPASRPQARIPLESPRHFARVAGKCQSGSYILPGGSIWRAPSPRLYLRFLKNRANLERLRKLSTDCFSSSGAFFRLTPHCSAMVASLVAAAGFIFGGLKNMQVFFKHFKIALSLPGLGFFFVRVIQALHNSLKPPG